MDIHVRMLIVLLNYTNLIGEYMTFCKFLRFCTVMIMSVVSFVPRPVFNAQYFICS